MNKNKPQRSAKEIRCQRSLEQLDMMRASGAIRHPALRGLWQIGNSQLAEGKYADKAHAMIDRIVTPIYMAQQFMPPRPPRIPDVSANHAILIGYEKGSHRPIIIHRDRLAHTLLVGAPSMGKSRLAYSLIDQIQQSNARVIPGLGHVECFVADFKGEAAGLLNLYPDDAAVFRPDQLSRNILQPKGDMRTYYHGLFSIIQRYSNMRRETETDLPGIVMRMNRSRRINDPYPALTDLARKLRELAKKEDRPNLKTASRDIGNLIMLLGKSARIRAVNNEKDNNNH